MKYWQSLAFVEMDQILPLARFAEELGFHGVTLSDHLITSQAQADRYLYSEDGDVLWHPDTPWPDPWIMATSIAQATTQLEIMTCVYILPMRDPFSAAKSISTAAFLSDNRINLGLGIGWQNLEFELTGQDFKNRGKRTDEAIEVIQKLMSGKMVDTTVSSTTSPRSRCHPLRRPVCPSMSGGIVKRLFVERHVTMAGWGSVMPNLTSQN